MLYKYMQVPWPCNCILIFNNETTIVTYLIALSILLLIQNITTSMSAFIKHADKVFRKSCINVIH